MFWSTVLYCNRNIAQARPMSVSDASRRLQRWVSTTHRSYSQPSFFDFLLKTQKKYVLCAPPRDFVRGGHIVLLYVILRVCCKMCLFHNSHTICSIAFTYETRLTANSKPFEPKLVRACSVSREEDSIHPHLVRTTGGCPGNYCCVWISARFFCILVVLQALFCIQHARDVETLEVKNSRLKNCETKHLRVSNCAKIRGQNN